MRKLKLNSIIAGIVFITVFSCGDTGALASSCVFTGSDVLTVCSIDSNSVKGKLKNSASEIQLLIEKTSNEVKQIKSFFSEIYSLFQSLVLNIKYSRAPPF